MPRYARQQSSGRFVHIIARLVNGAFRIGPEARLEYRRRLARALERSDWLLLGYTIMSNHVHLALRAGEDASAGLIKPLHTGFSLWLNRVQDARGPVFAERHTTIVVDDGGLGRVIAYLHNNAVRAGVVASASDCDWSSHREFVGLSQAPPWLRVGEALEWAGFGDDVAAFHDYVVAHGGDARDRRLSEAPRELRRQARRHLGPAAEISSPSQGADADEYGVQFIARPGALLRPRWTGTPATVIAAVETRFGLGGRLRLPGLRSRDVTLARRLALLVWVRLGGTMADMAAALGISRSAASQLVRGSALPGDDEIAAQIEAALTAP